MAHPAHARAAAAAAAAAAAVARRPVLSTSSSSSSVLTLFLFGPAAALLLLLFGAAPVAAAATNDADTKTTSVTGMKAAASYALGQAIPISCLNRTIETGEHITDEQGQLQYIPFMTCNETNRPLELYFGVEKEINCTNPVLSDPLYHLLEFYIHNDAPLSCRIPTHPLSASETLSSSSSGQAASKSSVASTSDNYIPLTFALSGALQLSHLHINPVLNVILHTSPDLAGQDADILAATAYSSPSLSSAASRIVIGDPLALRLSVTWYSSQGLPPSTTASAGLGGHVHFSTVVYCLLSCGVGVAASLAYFRGVELPRRIKRYGKERIGGERGGIGNGGGGYAFPGSGMVMNGYGVPGKRD